jgi:hypothetical protein
MARIHVLALILPTCLVSISDASLPACVVFGSDGLAETHCNTLSGMNNLPQTEGKRGAALWTVEIPDGLALFNAPGEVTLWHGGNDFTVINLGHMNTPVGGAYLDGKLYVACFGSWPTPSGDSGLAVVDVAGKHLESTHSFPIADLHVHNGFAFDFNGRKEIFVAVLGNPWKGPQAGKGLVRFDRATSQFDVETTMGALSARSAKQQADGSIYVLTQEPAGKETVLARLEEKNGKLVIVAQTTLPPRRGGDGGADVVLGVKRDTLWVTDREGSAGGKLYYYTYDGSKFVKEHVRETGADPRYTVALSNGDIVACNQISNDLSVYPGLALSPHDGSIQEQRIPTLKTPQFFIQTTKITSSTFVV